MPLVHVSVSLAPDRPFAVTAWSGSLALKLVYDVLHRVGVDFAKRERKPFFLEPIAAGGSYLLSGIYVQRGGELEPHPEWCWREVRAGEPLQLSAYFTDRSVAAAFLRGLALSPSIPEPSAELCVLEASVEEVELPQLSQPAAELPVCGKLYIDLEFASPTAFMFFGEDVLYPSPARLLFSAARTYAELCGGDLRADVLGLLKVVELTRYSVRTYWVDIGEGRRVPCFMGRARLTACGRRDVVTVVGLMRVAELCGVGISRALGFGRVRVRVSAE